jgi:predicted NAD-dependent protein-ADP-ribosyltransferase YbiA (DUF1768 family)
MVYSNLNTSIFYKENPGINLNDVGHESILYEIELFDEWVTITLGKINTIYADKNVVFYPIYLVIGGKMVAQLGLFEMSSEKSMSMIDEDGDMMVDLLDDPILYGFVTEEFIKKTYHRKIEPDEKPEPHEKKHEEPVKKLEEEEEEEDRVVKVKIPDHKKSEELEDANKKIADGVFQTDSNVVPPKMLPEETMEEATEIKKQFRKNPRNAWIANFMKNNHFKIHEVEKNGDCFIAVVRDAFKQQGKITDVSKLRALLAEEATEDIFNQHREVFHQLDSGIKEYENEMKQITETIKTLHSRIKEEKRPEELDRLKTDVVHQKKMYSDLQESIRDNKALISESLGEFASIDTLEKFRAYIKTSKFWVDSWAIGVLERRLNFKIIILSERSYDDGALDSVIDCGEIDKKIQESGSFSPEFYIMTTYSGDHYKLITYKDKRIFKLHEIPFFIKNLVINKCLEKNAGPFYIIPEFRDLVKTKHGRKEEDEVDEMDEKEDDTLHSELYDHKTVLSFYSKAPKSSKPGKATNIGEKIDDKDAPKYKKLAKSSDWRRKLDDDWLTQFKVDGHSWASVEHYYQGSKYKNGFPDFYLQFSMDSGSEISKSTDLARDATSTTGKKKGVSLRPKNVTIDANFYGERSKVVREEALKAKFQQNEDFKQLLLNTNDAKLIHFVRGEKAEPDSILMKVRKELRSST